VETFSRTLSNLLVVLSPWQGKANLAARKSALLTARSIFLHPFIGMQLSKLSQYWHENACWMIYKEVRVRQIPSVFIGITSQDSGHRG